MDLINRGVIIMHPRQPYVDWINRVAGLQAPLILEELTDDLTALLVPDLPSVEEMLEYVRPFKPSLFELELEGWDTDRSTWPKERTEALFDAWFELRAHSEVYDLAAPPESREITG